MTGPQVSVIIPAFNAATTLGAALDSAQAQTLREIEIIVVDDGSRDGTAALVEARAAADPRLRLIRQTNAGVAAARNAGIQAARSDRVAPLDADDLWHPEKLARQLEALERGGPRVGLVYCWIATVDATGRVISDNFRETYAGDAYAAMLAHNFIGNGSTPLMRRQAVAEAGGYDPGLRALGAQGCEDLKLYLAIAERWDFALAPGFLVHYRRAADSMSEDVRRMKRSFDLVLTEARHRHPELPERVFRWAESNICYWLGAKSLRRGDWRTGLELMTLTLLRDPAFVGHPMFRRGLKRLLGIRPPDTTDGLGEHWLSERRRRHIATLRVVKEAP